MTNKVSKLLVDINNVKRNSYCIYIGNNNFIYNIKQYCSSCVLGKVAIVTNFTVFSLYKKVLEKSSLNYNLILIPDGEKYKTNKTVNKIYDKLISYSFSRDSTIIAIGGGVVGDIAGFVASTYQRGLNLIHVPTTLMAQVDSSIGGKTGYNHKLGKNLIGSFYQPKLVIIDIQFLLTLDKRQLLSGISEIIKYSLINETPSFHWLERNLVEFKKHDLNILKKAIIYCCKCKTSMVSKDERDHGLRITLNFGHTFGHAIEAATKYTRYTHGEAISIGMLIAAFVSMKKSLLNEDIYYRIRTLLQKVGLPISIPSDISSKKILKHMRYDKKCLKGDNFRVVLLKDIGIPCVCSELKFDEMLNLLYEFRKMENN